MEIFQINPEEFKIIADVARDAVILTDDNGAVAYWNFEAEKIFGYKKDEVFGKLIHELVLMDKCKSGHLKGIEVFRRTGGGNFINKVMEVVAIRKDKSEVPIELSLSSLKIGGNWVAVAIVRDVSKRKELEKTKEEFMSIVIHELKTPISAIKWMSDILYKNLTEKQSEQLKILLRANEKMLILVNDLLDISSFESGEIEGGESIIDLKKFLGDILKKYEPIYSAKKQNIDLIIKEIFEIKTKVIFLEKILDNLLSNAVKYTPENGDIIIVADRVNDKIIISITDSGIGIPKEEQNKIFEKFYRGSNAKKFSDGTGLGLSLVKGLVDRMGGKIGFVSIESGGTKFTVELPIQ